MKLTHEQKEKLQEIGKKFNLRFIILHGSYAKGTPRQGSDLDIAVVGRERIKLDGILALHGELSSIFGDNRERELDLKPLHGVDPLFRYLVVRDGVLLYGDQTAYEEFKRYAFRDYMDSYDLRNLEEHMTRAKIKMLEERYAR